MDYYRGELRFTDQSTISRKNRERLQKAFSKNKTMEDFGFAQSSLSDEVVDSVCRFLKQNRTIRVLCFLDSTFTDAGVSKLLLQLAEDKVLREIRFEKNDLQDKAIEPFCSFIKCNTSITTLESPNDHIKYVDLLKHLLGLLKNEDTACSNGSNSTKHTKIANIEEEIGDIIQCNICMDKMRDPRSLPCQHAFCCSCLEDLVKHSDSSRIITCPTCRKQTKVPRHGVGDLPCDFKVKKLLELNMSSIQALRSEMGKLSVDLESKENAERSNSSENSCSICHNVAYSHCQTCRGDLCMGCSKKHNQQTLFSQHVVVAIDKDNQETAFCKVHPGNLQEYVCKDCISLACNFCVMKEHSGCNVIQANEYVKGCQQTINTSLNQLVEIQRELSLKEVAAIEQVSLRFAETASNLALEITRAANDRIKKIKEEKAQLLQTLRDDRKQLDEVLELAKDGKPNQGKVDELKSKCEGFMTTTSVSDVIVNFESLSRDIVQTICGMLDNQAVPSVQTPLISTGFVETHTRGMIGSITRGKVDLYEYLRNEKSD